MPFPELQRSARAVSCPCETLQAQTQSPGPAHLITNHQSDLADAPNVENWVSKQAKQIHILIAGAIKFLFC